ncbi:TetR/AcrR family transcriptional regulator [Acidobacterium sp. S8]|uniref:TetR/AcrR family transcriptional regulator n=1 Tax=Acidobacterium sp. S8 TaxID=1641854 RepID=UPI0020B1675F|nr:TetR family transcriptional regulator [Acidobacterium sp. S8]
MRRTRQLLQGALRTLMQSKSFDEIAVQDITEAATVNRATFYDHYTDKYALLESMVAGGFHQLLHERNVSYDGSCPAAVSAVILATCDYLTGTKAGDTACQRQSAFEPLVEAAVTAAIRRVLMAGMPKSASVADLPPEVIATAASWAIYGAVKEWFNTPERPSAEYVVPRIMQLVLPMLPSATSIEASVSGHR